MKILIYAIFSDNNIFLSCGDNLSIILKSLEHDTKMLLRWFNLNSLEANVEKVSINDSWKILTGKTFAIDCAVTCFCKTLLLRCLTVFRIRRSSQQRCSVKKLFLEISQNSQKNTCARVSFLKKRLAQVISYEFCEISKNIFPYRIPLLAASEDTSAKTYLSTNSWEAEMWSEYVNQCSFM